MPRAAPSPSSPAWLIRAAVRMTGPRATHMADRPTTRIGLLVAAAPTSTAGRASGSPNTTATAPTADHDYAATGQQPVAGVGDPRWAARRRRPAKAMSTRTCWRRPGAVRQLAVGAHAAATSRVRRRPMRRPRFTRVAGGGPQVDVIVAIVGVHGGACCRSIEPTIDHPLVTDCLRERPNIRLRFDTSMKAVTRPYACTSPPGPGDRLLRISVGGAHRYARRAPWPRPAEGWWSTGRAFPHRRRHAKATDHHAW